MISQYMIRFKNSCKVNYFSFKQYLYTIEVRKFFHKVENLYKDILHVISLVCGNIKKYTGVWVMILSSLMYIYNGNIYESIILGLSIYIMNLIYRYYKHKTYIDVLDRVDLEDLEKTLLSKNGDTLLDLIIEDCFSRNLVLYHSYSLKGYINSTEERKILENLLDSIALYLSPDVKKKLQLYYGSSLENILTEKCLIRVSVYAADHNKEFQKERFE